ncbi:MAG: 50S ribosomal protein L3 [Candidatus Bathyarchaeota archaeon]
MGHRKKHAPRRGSLAFRPRGRAGSLVGKVHYWPEVPETTLLGFAGYKAGMSHVFFIDDNPTSPNHGKEVFSSATIVETPPLFICAIRAYVSTVNGSKVLTEVWASNFPKDLSRAIKLPPKINVEKSLTRIEENLDRITNLKVVVSMNPRKAGIPKKKPEIMELAIGGKVVKEQFDYAKGILGKEVIVSDILKEGQYVDVISITKGKGFAGPVKRFGVRILQNKSRKTVRGVGCIGPWNPSLVMSSVPRAGQLGFAQRVEYNKKILKVGSNGDEVTPKGGFSKYGVIKGPYLIMKGSIPGPIKRLIRLRYAVRGPEKTMLPKITFSSIKAS